MTDLQLEKLWKEFADVPVNSIFEDVDTDFCHFIAGTNKFEIWQWFDQSHSKGVAWLLNQNR